MWRQASTRVGILTMAVLLGLGAGLALSILMATQAGGVSVMAAPSTSDRPAPLLDRTSGITIVKTAPLTIYQALGAGQTTIPYDLIVTNPSGFPILRGAIVTDLLPVGTTLLGGSTGIAPDWSGIFPEDGTVVTYTLAEITTEPIIDVGGYYAEVPVPVRDRSVYVNPRYCFSGTVNGVAHAFCEQVPVVTTVRAPDFSLEEMVPTPVCTGGLVTYTLAVTNPGGVRTSDSFTITGQIISVLNVLPGTISDGGTWTPDTITWNVPTNLRANGSNLVTRTFAVSIPTSTAHGTLLTNTYIVTSPEVLPTVSTWQSSDVMVTRLMAAFTNTTPACQDNWVVFYNSSTGATGYQWDLGDGSPINTQPNPTHLYASPGTYTVVLTATGTCGASVVTDSVTVYPPPTPNLQISPDPTQLGVTTYFNDTGSGGATWDWRFGDGATASTGVANVSHTYTGTPGWVTVMMTSTSAAGCYNITSRSLLVHPGAPYTVSMSAWPPYPSVMSSAAVTAAVTDQWGNPVLNGTIITFTATPPPAITAPSTDPTVGGEAHAVVTSTLVGPATITGIAPNGVSGATVVTFTPGSPYSLILTVAPLSLTVGNGAALTAVVFDQYNNRIPNQTVTFAVAPGVLGSGAVAPLIATTDGMGEAHASVTSTLSGPKTITATATAGVWDTAVVTFTTGAPHTIILVADPLTPTVGNNVALTATVTDRFGNLVSGETLTFSTVDDLGLGGIAPPTDSTDGAGDAHSSVMSTDAGPKIIQTTASNLVSATVLVDFSAGPPDLVTLWAIPATQVVGASSQLRARVLDQYLNVVAGEVISFTTSDDLGLGSISPITATTDVFGWADSNIDATLAGPKLVVATAANQLSGTVTVTFVAGAPYSLNLVALPTGLEVGSSAQLTATLTDQYANPLSGYTVALTTTDPLGLGILAPLVGTTNVSGQVFSTISSTLLGIKTVTAMQNGLSSIAQVTFTAGDPSTVTLLGVPDSLPLGQSAALTATVTDRFGNPIANNVVWFSDGDLGSGGISPLGDVTDDNGQAFSSINSTVMGSHVVQAQESTRGITGTTVITWTSGPPAVLSLMAHPLTPTVGSTTYLTATLTDQYGNPIGGQSVGFTTIAPLGSGSLSPGTDTTGVDGRAYSAISSTLTGQKTITATSNGLVATVEVTFGLGTLATIVVTPDPAVVEVGATQQFVATGYDVYSNVVPISPLWTTNGGTIDAGGLFTAQATPVSGRLVTATDGTVSGAAIVDVVHGGATAIELAPAAATVAAGESQPYTVTARDAYNNTWNVSAASMYTITPGAGGAWVSSVYTSELAGTWTVVATYLGLTDTAALTVTHAPLAISAALSPDPHTVGIGGQVVYTLIATDTYGNAWNATASGAYTVTPAAGGSWAANVYTSQYTGTWTVTATVPNATATAMLAVTELPAASFIRVPAGEVCISTTIQFTDTSTGGPTAWLWDFGDSVSTNVQHPTHAYTSTGLFTVTLDVTNPYGSDTTADMVSAVSAPVIAITRSPIGGVCTGVSVAFTATNSGGSAVYLWSFGDGVTATGQVANHAYSAPGTYTVWLTGTNACALDVVSTTVTVSGPSASFIRHPAGDVPVNATVQFTDTSTGGPTVWLWDFGDGFTSAVQHPTHTYAISGTFTITLTVTGTCGSDSTIGTITVLSGCVGVSIANLGSDSPVDLGEMMYFTATVTGDVPITYTWDWGDGTPPVGGVTVAGAINASHLYTVAGGFTVTLSVENSCGSDSRILTVSVNAVPGAPDHITLVAVPGNVPLNGFSVLTATVYDGFNTPLAGQILTFTTSDPLGAGSLVPLFDTTDAQGQATSVISSTVLGVKRVTATAFNMVAGSVNVRFFGPSTYLPVMMRGYEPPRATLTLVANPMALVVGDSSILEATALDVDGSPIQGIVVTFFTPDPLGGGTLKPLATTTDVNGHILATIDSTLVGTVRVTAEASNGTSDTITLVFRSADACAPQLFAISNTGPEPREVALDVLGRRVFVAHAEGVTVLDPDSFAAITEVSSLASAHGIAYDPDHDHIWVTTRDGTGRVRVLEGLTYTIVADLPAGDLPHSVAYNPTNGRVYVTNYGSGSVEVYSAAGLVWEQTLTGFSQPAHIGVNHVTNKVYIANHGANAGVTVIDGTTHDTGRINTALIDAYGVAVDTTRNLVYVTAISHGRIIIIDGATDEQIGGMDVRRGSGDIVPLRVIAVNPDVGSEGHLLVVTSSEDSGQDQLLLIPNGWPSLGTPVPLNVTSYPQEGIALDPITQLVWVTSVGSGQANVAWDGLPVCSIPFSLRQGNAVPSRFQILPFATP